MNYLFYEEVRISFNVDFTVQQEVILAEMKDIEIRKSDVSQNLRPTERDLPLFDDLDMTQEQYEAFWSHLEAKMLAYQEYWNDKILQRGINFPYWNFELLTGLEYRPHALITVVSLYYNSI